MVHTLIKNVLDIYTELILMLRLKLYNEDFEDAFLKATINYYSRKPKLGLWWILVLNTWLR